MLKDTFARAISCKIIYLECHHQAHESAICDGCGRRIVRVSLSTGETFLLNNFEYSLMQMHIKIARSRGEKITIK